MNSNKISLKKEIYYIHTYFKVLKLKTSVKFIGDHLLYICNEYVPKTGLF